jgi:long-chain acyl-CoA synthetase
MSLNLATILRTSAQKFPKKPAVIIGETTLSYEALHGHAQRFAGALKRLGVKRGQHVALMLPNVPQFTIAYFGAHYLGTPVVPLNVLLTADEVAYHLDDSDAVVLVAWEGFAEAARAGFERVPGCKQLIIVRQTATDLSAPEGAHNFTALLASAEPVLEPAATGPDDTAVLLYTSGTTGRPKGAELTHFNMYWNCDYVVRKLDPVGHEGVVLTVLPLFHSYGQTCMQNATLHAGATLVLLPRFEPLAALELMQRHSVTSFAGVPTMYFALLNHPDAGKYEISLKHCTAGGSAMPVEVMRAFDATYGVNILEGYGLSETSPVASFNTLERPKKPGSIGIPLEGVEFKLVDDEGRTITQPGVPGEICIKGPNVMKGYYKRPEARAGLPRATSRSATRTATTSSSTAKKT